MGRLGWLFLGALVLDLGLIVLLGGIPLYRRAAPPVPAGGPPRFIVESAPARGEGKAARPAEVRYTVPTLAVTAPSPSPVPLPAPAPGNGGASSSGAAAPAAAGNSLPPLPPGQTSLFDITVPSRRIVYLIDASGSMLDRFDARGADARSRYDAAVQEVRRSIAALPPDAAFDVVLFADRAKALAPEPLAAGPEASRRAEAFLAALPDDIGGGTDLLGGLAAAFRLAPDAVFLLTDGGATEAEWKLLRGFAVLQGETTPAPRLYAFGLASPMDAGGDRLLFKLCQMTGGSYQGMESLRK
jgi:hypothetical protein